MSEDAKVLEAIDRIDDAYSNGNGGLSFEQALPGMTGRQRFEAVHRLYLAGLILPTFSKRSVNHHGLTHMGPLSLTDVGRRRLAELKR